MAKRTIAKPYIRSGMHTSQLATGDPGDWPAWGVCDVEDIQPSASNKDWAIVKIKSKDNNRHQVVTTLAELAGNTPADIWDNAFKVVDNNSEYMTFDTESYQVDSDKPVIVERAKVEKKEEPKTKKK